MSKPIEIKLFIKKWIEAHKQSENQAWIASELNMSKQAVSYRANYLRGRGVRLPNLRTLNVEELNKMIDYNHET